ALSTARLLRLRRRVRVTDRRLPDLAVRPVGALLLLLLLDLTLQADRGRLGPRVRAQLRLILRERFLEGGDAVRRRGRLRENDGRRQHDARDLHGILISVFT